MRRIGESRIAFVSAPAPKKAAMIKMLSRRRKSACRGNRGFNVRPLLAPAAVSLGAAGNGALFRLWQKLQRNVFGECWRAVISDRSKGIEAAAGGKKWRFPGERCAAAGSSSGWKCLNGRLGIVYGLRLLSMKWLKWRVQHCPHHTLAHHQEPMSEDMPLPAASACRYLQALVMARIGA